MTCYDILCECGVHVRVIHSVGRPAPMRATLIRRTRRIIEICDRELAGVRDLRAARVVGRIAAEETEGGIKPAPNRGVGLREEAEVPL